MFSKRNESRSRSRSPKGKKSRISSVKRIEFDMIARKGVPVHTRQQVTDLVANSAKKAGLLFDQVVVAQENGRYRAYVRFPKRLRPAQLKIDGYDTEDIPPHCTNHKNLMKRLTEMDPQLLITEFRDDDENMEDIEGPSIPSEPNSNFVDIEDGAMLLYGDGDEEPIEEEEDHKSAGQDEPLKTPSNVVVPQQQPEKIKKDLGDRCKKAQEVMDDIEELSFGYRVYQKKLLETIQKMLLTIS